METVSFPYDGTTMTVEQQINTSIKKVRLVIHSINFGDGTKYPNSSTIASSFLSTPSTSISNVASLTYSVYYSGVGQMNYTFYLTYFTQDRKFVMPRNDNGKITAFYNLVSYSINNNIAWDY